jgi:hypothetical protein
VIDWRRVRAAGFEFAFLKATERRRTFDDERFGFNRRAAKAAGFVVGAYHFARPDNNSPEAEAQHFPSLRPLVFEPGGGEATPKATPTALKRARRSSRRVRRAKASPTARWRTTTASASRWRTSTRLRRRSSRGRS